MKYIILVLWTFSLFLLMFISFPFRVECRPTRAMGPGPPYMPSTGVFLPQQYSAASSSSSSIALGLRASVGRLGVTSSCPVLEEPTSSRLHNNQWSDLVRTDITTKVWETPLVLEGMARSRSEVRSDGTYGVTFDLIRVVKGDAPLLRRRKQFRLQFLDNPTPPTPGNASLAAVSSGAGSAAFIPTRGGSALGFGSGRSSTNHVSSNNPHKYNKALSLRSSTSLSNNNNHQRSSLSSNGSSARAGGTINLKSASNLHSNLVTLQSSQQRRPPATIPLTTTGFSSSRIRSASNNNSPIPRTVQFNQQYVRNHYAASGGGHHKANYNNLTIGSGRNSKLVRIARSHQLQKLQRYGGVGGHPSTNYDITNRHTRHGRVDLAPLHNIAVNSASGGGGGGVGKCLPPRATVKTGRKYFVFAAKVDSHFVAVFSPELANKRNTKSVDSILCKGCGQAPSVVAQKEEVLRPKERLRIRCRLRAGNPIPVLSWYKDGRPVNMTDPRLRFRAKRRQSVLIIRKAKDVDKGVYKCEAKNVFGSAHAITRVITSPTSPKPEKPPSPKTVGTTPTTLWPVPSSVCPYDSYCLNGGTCSYFEQIGEYVCQCAEGYKGQRCDTKDIPNSGGYLSSFCRFGNTNPDYPC